MNLSPLTPPGREEALRLMLHMTEPAIIRMINPTDIRQVIHSVWPGLDVLNEDKAVSLIAIAISQTVAQLSTPTRMDGVQVRRAACMVLEDYRMLSIEDIVLCLKMGIKGEWGEFYGRFDVQVIMDWLHAYYLLRTQALRLASLRQQSCV